MGKLPTEHYNVPGAGASWELAGATANLALRQQERQPMDF